MAENDNTFLNADNIYEDVEGESGKTLNLEIDQKEVFIKIQLSLETQKSLVSL